MKNWKTITLAGIAQQLRTWLIFKLGGMLSHACCERSLFWSLPRSLQSAVGLACRKVQNDPGFSKSGFSNLGRNVKRDEACEWTKLYLKDAGIVYDDSDVHLACELYYRLFLRPGVK